MVTISHTDILNMMRIELLARLRAMQDKIHWFEQKYACSFEEFEVKVQTKNENFEHWDDYMEWQAYQKASEDIQHDITELQNGNFEITG